MLRPGRFRSRQRPGVAAGGDTLVRGAGAAFVPGADLLAPAAGQARGRAIVEGFGPGADHVAFEGRAAGPAMGAGAAGATLALPGASPVTLPGWASPPGVQACSGHRPGFAVPAAIVRGAAPRSAPRARHRRPRAARAITLLQGSPANR